MVKSPMTSKLKKIGIIDSGIGGMTLLKVLLNKNLNAEYFYISDEDNVPYGNKSQAFMLERINKMTQKLLESSIDLILIACNTATAETIDELRCRYPQLPFVGIEPYINYLNTGYEQGENIGLILTEATFKSNRFKNLVKEKDPSNKIKIFPLSNLALIIEKLKHTSFNELQSEVERELLPLKSANLDKLILGCTHYPLISNHIQKYLNVNIIDPALPVIKQVILKAELVETNLKSNTFRYNPNIGPNWSVTSLREKNFLNI
jgi:glutamate racemase